MLTKLASLTPDERAAGVIAVSAGNHAQALAYCAALEGIDALVVMWRAASAAKIEATRAYGARVDLEAEGPGTAFERLEELRLESGRTFVHPFDDPLVMAGQGTVGLEIGEDVHAAAVVVVPVGGGGLAAGIATALPDARIVAVEPVGAPALHAALEAGEPVTVQPDSIADGLHAPFAGRLALEIAQARQFDSVLVEEDEIAAAMRFLYERAKLACEPAGAVGVAALQSGRIELEAEETIVVVVTGGNVAAQTAAAILAQP